MVKDKSRSSEKTQVLGDGSNRMVGDLSKKYIEIYDSDISENESISDISGNYLTLALKNSSYYLGTMHCDSVLRIQQASLAHLELQYYASQVDET